jgi:hypothetical protein
MKSLLSVYVHLNDESTFKVNKLPTAHMISVVGTDAVLIVAGGAAYALRDALNEILEGVPTPEAPGHTDLMVTPESIDAWLVENPPPEDEVIGLTDAKTCVNHPDELSVTNLDGDELCQACADSWCRGEEEDYYGQYPGNNAE